MAAKKAAKKKTLGRTKKTGDQKAATKGAKTYDPKSEYAVGDIVYHPKWQDEGPVVDVAKTADGIDKVTVDFAEVGPKRLVMKYDLEL